MAADLEGKNNNTGQVAGVRKQHYR